MESLVFSLNATVPVFLLMILGQFLRKTGWIDDEFADKMNTFVFRVPLPYIMEKTVENVAGTATPLGLMAMGASFDIRKAYARIKPSVTAAFIKLVGFCAVFLPVAVHMGFRREELVAILVMLGSATTVSCFVMARNMGHDGVLSSGVVMLTTLFSAFTLTGWLYVLRSLGLV